MGRANSGEPAVPPTEASHLNVPRHSPSGDGNAAGPAAAIAGPPRMSVASPRVIPPWVPSTVMASSNLLPSARPEIRAGPQAQPDQVVGICASPVTVPEVSTLRD